MGRKVKWTPERIQEFENDYANIADTSVIAAKYGMKVKSVHSKAGYFGFKRGNKFCGIWTEEQSAIFEKEYPIAKDLEELGKRINKTIPQMYGRAYRVCINRYHV